MSIQSVKMSHKFKNIPTNETLMCEKYINKMLRQEKMFATKRSPAPAVYQEKISNSAKQSLSVNNQRSKQKPNVKQAAPQKQSTNTNLQKEKEHGDGLTTIKEVAEPFKRRTKSTPRCRSTSRERESWGQLLHHHHSKDRTSTFSNFDPLRTVHFLSKELHTKLQNVLPDEEGVLQMVSDIQHALKRIPPEVTTLLRMQPLDFLEVSKSRLSQEPEKPYCFNRPPMSNKSCQTPPTLYQEDTERFQKIMEENTYRLEASCKQLEVVCTNLQNEKEMTEKELDEARENVELLCNRVKQLEREMEEISGMKIKQLEEEKQRLQAELDKAMEDMKDNPTVSSLKKLIDDLKKQKLSSDETCARLEYDMTLLKMEKEKFATMLSVRDREIKEIQEEMSKIQDQVNSQLSKLNGEVLSRVNSMKTFSDPFCDLQDNKDYFIEIGDATISSITTNESERDFVHFMKESPCGDAEVTGITKEQQENFLQRLVQIKSSNVEFDLAVSKDQDGILEDFLKELTPSCRALINSSSC